MKNDNKVTIVIPESVSQFVQLQANNDFMIYEDPPYLPVVADFLSSLTPQNCLELGAGIGRMSVYFNKRYAWPDAHFTLQDGDSGTEQYSGVRDSNDAEYYNSFAATADFCHANDMSSFNIINKISHIDRDIDFCYSFASIGFHWHINLYLDQLVAVLSDNAKLMFEIRAPFAADANVDETKRQQYQDFFTDQINYANNHPDYQVESVVNLDNYDGYYYKDRTYFLILSKIERKPQVQ